MQSWQAVMVCRQILLSGFAVCTVSYFCSFPKYFFPSPPFPFEIPHIFTLGKLLMGSRLGGRYGGAYLSCKSTQKFN